jgi:hypothetical protein
MFKSDRSHTILSAIGALLLSATCVVAAAAPASDAAGAALRA